MNGVILRRTLLAPLSRPMVRRMASQPTGEELGLTGWKYHFNTQTIVGRRNIVLAVYGGCIGGYFLMKMRKPKEKPQEAA